MNMLPNNPKVFAPQKFVWKDPDHNPLLTKFISILLYFSCFIIIFMGILTRVVIPKAQAASISPIPPISQDSKPKYEVFGGEKTVIIKNGHFIYCCHSHRQSPGYDP